MKKGAVRRVRRTEGWPVLGGECRVSGGSLKIVMERKRDSLLESWRAGRTDVVSGRLDTRGSEGWGVIGRCVAKARRALLRRVASGSRLSKGFPVGGANSVPGRMGCDRPNPTRRISLSNTCDRIGPIDKPCVGRLMREATSISGRRRCVVEGRRARFIAGGT